MRKKSKNHRKIWIFMLLILISVSNSKMQVNAANCAIDMNKKGSITIELKAENKVLTEGEFTLYQIADIIEEHGKINYQYINGFEECGVSIVNLDESGLAMEFEKKISSYSDKTTQKVSENGKIENK